jgi:phosphatidylinositol alpha-1,6-mannosyltransferase
MKICFLNKSLNIKGGVGRYGLDISENILKIKEIESVVVLIEQKSDYTFGKPILLDSRHIKGFVNLFINAFKIRKYVKECDIVHALDGYPYGVIAALANIGINKKLIINGIGTYSILPLEQSIKKNLMKWAYKKANTVLCISRYTKEQLLKRVKLSNVVVINHGVDYKKYADLAPDPLKNDERKEKIILSVGGGLKRRKGLHISISAVGVVKKKYPDIKYYIVGSQTDDTDYFLKLKSLIKENNLEKNVIFLENLSDEQLIELYYLSDIFLLTSINIGSDFEGFGLVYLEAGACSKPVIGAYGSGAEDAIINGETGILVPQNDVQKTAEAILKLLDNPKLAKAMGENGKKRAEKMSWEDVAKKYVEEYKKI